MTSKEALENVVKAWESLPGNKYYTREDIQNWLVEQMKPAIDAAREALKYGDRPTPTYWHEV